MVDSSPLQSLLQAQKDWNLSAIFTDKMTIVGANKMTLLPEELKYDFLNSNSLGFM